MTIVLLSSSISIHALLAESDLSCSSPLGQVDNFYPRSPCGERRCMIPMQKCCVSISIHALLAESDQSSGAGIGEQVEFLSTLSLRRATTQFSQKGQANKISIHALLAESDHFCIGIIQLIEHFYPRSPCGERPVNLHPETRKGHFYPRSPCGERQPESSPYHDRNNNFYPRSPCGERPVFVRLVNGGGLYFYPRSPCGERPWQRGSRITYVEISIHALLAESDVLQS